MTEHLTQPPVAMQSAVNVHNEWDITKESWTGTKRSTITTQDMDTLLLEMNKVVQNVKIDHEDHLYVPGKIVLIYETLLKENNTKLSTESAAAAPITVGPCDAPPGRMLRPP